MRERARGYQRGLKGREENGEEKRVAGRKKKRKRHVSTATLSIN